MKHKKLIIFSIALIGVYKVHKYFNSIDIMARTIWGEARSEGVNGMRGVGHVIMNRAKLNTWYGRTTKEVALKEYQFTAWNINDPNRVKMLNVTKDDPQFKQAIEIATNIINGVDDDLTGGATHYHTKQINPYWASSMKELGTVGNHVYYRA